MLFVHKCTGKEITFVCRNRRLDNALLLDMRAQRHVRELLLKRHWRIGRSYWCDSRCKIVEKTACQNGYGQKKSDHDTLDHFYPTVCFADPILRNV